jgi:hypothetical protein
MTRGDPGLLEQLAAPDAATAPDVTAGLSMLANISVQVGRLADQIEQQRTDAQRLWTGVRPLTNIPVPQITSTNGTADYPELLSPRTGYWWEVKLAGAQTFTAGSVNLYLNAAQDSQIVGAFPQAGYLIYSGQQLLFNWNSRLVIKAVAVTGNVTPSLSVVEIADWALPAYLI